MYERQINPPECPYCGGWTYGYGRLCDECEDAKDEAEARRGDEEREPND